MNVVSEHVLNANLPQTEDDQRWSIQAVIDVAGRRWRAIVGTVLACLALSVAYIATTPDSFSASIVLLMDTHQAAASPLQSSQEALIDPAVLDSQVEILKSQRVAEQVVDRLQLEADPNFAGGSPGLRTRFVAWLLGRNIAQPSPASLRSAAAEALTHMVKITRLGHSYLAEVVATTLDPALSAAVANAIGDAYIQDLLDSALKSNERNVTWMRHRVDEVRAGADAAAAALSNYDRDQVGVAASGRRQELADAAARARADYDALQNRSLRLAQFIQQQSLPVTDARVLTYAEPPKNKSAPKSNLILLLAALGGCIGGGALAWLREVLDRRLRWPQQVQQEFGLPVAGIVPALRRAGAVAVLFDGRRPWCAATETLRKIKILVDHNVRHGPGGVALGLTSAWPGEGRSTMALNMALLLSEIGARVLVIDADFKKPDLSKALRAAAPRGLADLVDGSATADNCIARDERGFDVLGLGSGPVPLHPFGLLGSRRLQAALAEARATYDYVLVDLPALLASVDAQAIAPSLDAFLIVAEYGRTSIDDLKRALSMSDSVADRVAVAVLNKGHRADDRVPHRRRRRGWRDAVSA